MKGVGESHGSQDEDGGPKSLAEEIAVPIGAILIVVLMLVPFFVLIFVPWKILHDSVGLSHIAAGLIAVPFGAAAASFLYWLLATGRATWDD